MNTPAQSIDAIEFDYDRERELVLSDEAPPVLFRVVIESPFQFRWEELATSEAAVAQLRMMWTGSGYRVAAVDKYELTT